MRHSENMLMLDINDELLTSCQLMICRHQHPTHECSETACCVSDWYWRLVFHWSTFSLCYRQSSD